MPETVAAVASAIIAAVGLVVGLFISYISERKKELRRDEVFAWANEGITCLQNLFLVTAIKDQSYFDPREKIAVIVFQSSVLIERGRLLFKNEKNAHGADKENAYRGLRPQILDQLVIAHQISLGWLEANDETKIRMRMVAESCVRRFVSLAQEEVGRERTACVATQQGGDGIHLSKLLASVDGTQLKNLKLGIDKYQSN